MKRTLSLDSDSENSDADYDDEYIQKQKRIKNLQEAYKPGNKTEKELKIELEKFKKELEYHRNLHNINTQFNKTNLFNNNTRRGMIVLDEEEDLLDHRKNVLEDLLEKKRNEDLNKLEKDFKKKFLFGMFEPSSQASIIKSYLKYNFNQNGISSVIDELKFPHTGNNTSLINTLNNHIENLKNKCLEIFKEYNAENAEKNGIDMNELKSNLIDKMIIEVEKRIRLNKLIPGYKLVSEKTLEKNRMMFNKRKSKKSKSKKSKSKKSKLKKTKKIY